MTTMASVMVMVKKKNSIGQPKSGSLDCDAQTYHAQTVLSEFTIYTIRIVLPNEWVTLVSMCTGNLTKCIRI